MDSQERERIITRGRLAKDVLENEAFHDALNTVVNEIFTQFLATGPEEAVNREKLWATGQAVERLSRQLDTFVQTGAMEAKHKSEDAKKR